jgi:DNA repair protein RecO (recombination protein O)
LRALAKGVRKVRSRKAGHLEPFTRVDLQLATGRNWYVISQAEAQQTFNELRENLDRISYASYVVELVDKFTYEEEENAPLYRLLVSTMERLAAEEDLDLVVRYSEMRMLDYLGFRPELFECVVSGEAVQPIDQYFSAAQGGVVTPGHTAGVAAIIPVSMDALRYLRHLQRSSWRDALKARDKINPEIRREMEVLMQHYITYILERGLNTPGFMRRMRQRAQAQTTPADE